MAGVRLQRALSKALQWRVQVSSSFDVADQPRRGFVPDGGRGWRLVEMLHVTRWDVFADESGLGRSLPMLHWIASLCLQGFGAVLG